MAWKFTIYFEDLSSGIDITEDVDMKAISSLGGSASTNDFIIKIPNIVLKLIDEYGENPGSFSSYYSRIKKANIVYLDIEYGSSLLFRGYASADVLKTFYDPVGKSQVTEVSFFHIFDTLSRKIVNFKTSTISEMKKIVTYIIENAISSTQIYELSDLEIYPGDPLNSYSGGYIRGKYDYDKVYMPNVPESSPEGYLKIGQEIVKYGKRKVVVEVVDGINVYWLAFYPYPSQNYRSDDLTNSDRAQFGTLPEYYDADNGGILKTRPYSTLVFDSIIDIKNIFENTSDSEQEQRFDRVISEGSSVYLESELNNVKCYGTKGSTLFELLPYETTEIVDDPPVTIGSPTSGSIAKRTYASGSYSFMGATKSLAYGRYYFKYISILGFIKSSRQQDGNQYPLIAVKYGFYGSNGKKYHDAVVVMDYNYPGSVRRIGLITAGANVDAYVWYYIGKTSDLNTFLPNPVDATMIQANGGGMVYHNTSTSLIKSINILTPISESTGKGLMLVLMKSGSLDLYEVSANRTGSSSIEDVLSAGTLLWEKTGLNIAMLSVVNGVISGNDIINAEIGIYKVSYVDTSDDVHTISFYSDSSRNYALAQDYNNEVLYNFVNGCDLYAGMLSAYYVIGVDDESAEGHYSGDVGKDTLRNYLRKKINVNDVISVKMVNKRAIDVLNDFRKLFLAFMFMDEDMNIVIRSISRLFEDYVVGVETVLTWDDVEDYQSEIFNVEMFTPGSEFLSTDYLSSTFDSEKTKIFRQYNEISTFTLQKDLILDYFDYVSIDGVVGVVIGVKIIIQSGEPIIEYTALMKKNPDATMLFSAL